MGYLLLPLGTLCACLAAECGAHLLPKAGATQERTLLAVRCSGLFGPGLGGDTALPHPLCPYWYPYSALYRHPPLAIACCREITGRRGTSLVVRGSRRVGHSTWSPSPMGSACQRAYMASRAGLTGVGAPVRHAATCAFTRCSVALSASRYTRMSGWPGCVRRRPRTLLKGAPLARKPQNPCWRPRVASTTNWARSWGKSRPEAIVVP